MFKYYGISVMNLTVFALPVSLFIFIFARQQKVNIKEDRLLNLRKLSTELVASIPYLRQLLRLLANTLFLFQQ